MQRTLPLLLLSFLAGCSGSGGSDGRQGGRAEGTLVLEITDAPISHALVEEARITVDRVSLHEDGDATSGFVTIFEGRPLELDLLDLRNGVAQGLAQAVVPAGTYGQIRIRLSDAYLRLTNGNEYTVASGTLQLTSQETSGFKVFVDPPFEVLSGISTSLLLDLDLTKTFRPVPANDPPNATRFHLHPVIRAANRSFAGDLRGRIGTLDGQGTLVPVEMATVLVLPPGVSDPEQSLASTATEADGSYAILALPEGTYDVRASLDTLAGARADVRISAGSVTQVDLLLR